MHHHAYVERVIDLIDPAGNILLNMDYAEAARRVATGDPTAVAGIDGQFAICVQEGKRIRLARSIGRPMRYFLAKREEGPCLLVAERIDELADRVRQEGWGNQFHPSYTRMVPAHYVLQLELIGCPDPNPNYQRFLVPQRNTLPVDLDAIGQAYISQLAHECQLWLDRIAPDAPIGVMFSGGIDSGAVLTILYHLLLKRNDNPARLKAFTLSVGPNSDDALQARKFCEAMGAPMLLEVVEVSEKDLDWRSAVRVIEDYKPLDVQSATMGLALCNAIRKQYPDWRYLVDGDGGDENLKDYPIHENPELTIRSVLNNALLYHEGWGVNAIKHSLVYSGGQSRGHVRTFAPGKSLGFEGFSPFALPSVIAVSERIPFIGLTDWNTERLYDLKGQIVERGVRAVTGMEMPIYPKRRFQHGATTERRWQQLFPADEAEYRDVFSALYAKN